MQNAKWPTFTCSKLSKFRTIKDNEILETAANVPRRQITVVLETANKTTEIANPNARKSNSIWASDNFEMFFFAFITLLLSSRISLSCYVMCLSHCPHWGPIFDHKDQDCHQNHWQFSSNLRNIMIWIFVQGFTLHFIALRSIWWTWRCSCKRLEFFYSEIENIPFSSHKGSGLTVWCFDMSKFSNLIFASYDRVGNYIYMNISKKKFQKIQKPLSSSLFCVYLL